MLVQNPIGIALAALLSMSGPAVQGLLPHVIFMPTMLSFVIVGFIWKLILSPLWGVAPQRARRPASELPVRALARPGRHRADHLCR